MVEVFAHLPPSCRDAKHREAVFAAIAEIERLNQPSDECPAVQPAAPESERRECRLARDYVETAIAPALERRRAKKKE